MTYVAYYRVSTKDQGRSGLGLEAQERAVQEYLRRHGGALVGAFIEVESGKNNYRTELEAAKKHAIASGATLLIAKLDRLARRASFILSLLDTAGLKIKVCDLENADRMTLSIMAVIAEKEAEMISQRTKDALAAARNRGQKLGMQNPAIAAALPKAIKHGAALKKRAVWERARYVGPLMEAWRKRGSNMAMVADLLHAHGARLAPSHFVNGVTWDLRTTYRYYKVYSFIGPQRFWADLPPDPRNAQADGAVTAL